MYPPSQTGGGSTNAHYEAAGEKREGIRRRGRAGGNQPGCPGDPPRDVEGIRADRDRLVHRVSPGDHMERVRRKGEPLREPADEPRHPARPQGRDPADELSGVAAGLLRHPQDRRAGGSAELPLFGRGDSLLLRSGRRGRAAVRPGVHRPRGGSRRSDAEGQAAVLHRRQLSDVRGELPPPGGQPVQRRAQGGIDRSGRRGDLLLVRHDRVPQGDSAQPREPHARGGRRAEAPRPDARRRVPLHSAAVSHRREDALVWQPDLRLARGAAQGRAPGDDHPHRGRGEVHDRLAAGAVGAGHPGRHRPRGDRPAGLRARPVAADAHRGAARAAEPDPALEAPLSEPPVRHELRPVRVDRPGLRPLGRREHRPRRRHRRARLRLAGAHRRRPEGGRPAGRGRRIGREGPRRDDLLLQG